MSYFSATMKVNQEGDVLISDDTIQGLGTTQRFLRFFFGSLFIVAHTPPYNPLPEASAPLGGMASSPSTMVYQGAGALPPRSEADKSSASSSIEEIPAKLIESLGTMLIACVPNPGYFVAGGVAGIVSRTSTAPLDRLKVYLIAQTSVAEEAVVAAKHGNIIKAVMNAWRPLATATRELWQAGGMRSLYAGESILTCLARGL
jgi:solute carrier family 25 phosphate transporter 23/24/25/41